jgi:integrase
MPHGHIKKQPNGKYKVCFDFGSDELGKRKRKFKTFDNNKAANAALSEHNHQIDVGDFVLPSNMNVSEWLDYWLEHIVIPKSAMTTVYGYNNIIGNYLNPKLGKVKLQKLSPKDVQEYLTWLMNEKDLSSNTAIKHYEMLKNALGVAEKQDHIRKNPINRVERPKKMRNEASFYTAVQLAELLTLVKGHRLEVAVLLASYYGLRRGEICGLRWKDVDFDHRIIYICNTRTSAGSIVVEKDTKTDASTRKLSMPGTIISILKSEKEHQANRREELGEKYFDSEFIVVMNGGKPYRPNYLSELFTDFLKKNNLPKIVLHELRHTFASLSNEAGIPEFNIGKALGHSHPSTTKKVYTHLFDPVHTNAVNSVADIVDSAVKKNKQKLEEKINRIDAVLPKVINEWNPVGFSVDELDYNSEIEVIREYLLAGKDESELGKFVYEAFRESFGKRFFTKSLSECEEISKSIVVR